jgi:hypothetical protein
MVQTGSHCPKGQRLLSYLLYTESQHRHPIETAIYHAVPTNPGHVCEEDGVTF